MLNNEQGEALRAITTWLNTTGEPFFLLSGSAGTGKTFSVKELLNNFRGRVIFTAPTNKATKVLRDSVSSDNYKPETRTIYSLLGLQLAPNGEVRELVAPEDPIDLSQYRCVIVDEASMISKAGLWSHINAVAERYKVKFLFMGDPCQLPPVKEVASPIWQVTMPSTHLTKVMRHDNQILDLATQLRERVEKPFGKLQLETNWDNSVGEGVLKLGKVDWTGRIIEDAKLGRFSAPDTAKAIAWRNVTVDSLNSAIRSVIYPGSTRQWETGDRVLFTAPAKNMDDEVFATTDDEGTVESVSEEWHPAYGEFKIWRLAISIDKGPLVVAYSLHQASLADFNRRVEDLAAAARENKRKWHLFWEFKEAFHGIRHAYAITAHRSQGSSYDTAYVDFQDILRNPTPREAMQCLYVACTRAKKKLFLG